MEPLECVSRSATRSGYQSDFARFAIGERNLRGVSQGILDFGNLVGVVHQFEYGLLRRLGMDGRVIGDVARARSFGAEFAVHFHAHSNDLNTTLSRLAMQIVAVAGCDGKKEKFASIE